MGTKYDFRRVLAVALGLTMLFGAGSAFGQGKHGRGGGKGWKEGKHEWKEARKEQKREQKEYRKEQRWEEKAWRKAEKREDRRGGWKGNRGGGRQDRYVNYGQIFLGDFWNGGSRGDKNHRKQQKRIWKEEKRALKEERKAARHSRHYERDQRRYARYYNAGRDYDNYRDSYYDDDNRYYDDGRSDWKRQLLQTVIANVVGDRLGDGGYNVLSQAAPVYGVPVNYGYQPDYSPSYANVYQPDYGDGDSPLGGNSLISGLLSSPLVGELIDRYAGGNGIASELIGSFVSQGYDQGFLAGQYARQNGDGDNYYRDPYAYQNGVYDPYSVSLGQNRELLGEGYRLGYEDALRNRSEYDPQSDGNTDLVSLLLNNVLGAV